MLLSILIPSLVSRKKKLENLMKILRPQLTPGIEVLIDPDDGRVSIGVKRNRLLQRSTGQYVCFVDDDDTVASDYIASIMKGVEAGADCISMPGTLFENGVEMGPFVNKPGQAHVVSKIAGKIQYFRGVGHLNPMKREIAVQFQFPDSSYAEDYSWSSALERSGLIKTCYDVDHPIYFYDFWNNKPDSRQICNLAIVMPVYNHVYTTIRCVESLIANTKDPNYRLIMVDDCSDGVSEVQDYAAELSRRLDYRFHYIRNPVNKGVNASWNVGVNAARALLASYVAIVNNDLLFTPDWDIPLVEAMKDPAIGIVSPLSTYGKDVPLDWPKGKYRDVNPAGYRGYMPILGACFAARSETWRKIEELSESLGEVGTFPESMRIYYGDNWAVSAAQYLGLQCGYDDASYIHHLFCVSSSSVAGSIFEDDGRTFLALEKKLGRHMECFGPPPEGFEPIRPNEDQAVSVVESMMDFMAGRERVSA